MQTTSPSEGTPKTIMNKQTNSEALPLTTGPASLSAAEQEMLSKFFEEGWSRVEDHDEHWIHGWDRDHYESISYCYECAEKEIEKLLKEDPEGEWIVDGGWGGEADSTPFCEGCGKLLSASLTNYGCESELEHFTYNGFNVASDEDRRAMHEVIESRGWEEGEHSGDYERKKSEQYYAKLHALARKILQAISL